MADLDAAERFLAAHARVLERRRFERAFRDGDPGPVRDAVAAYRNADGGFGQGLEPDVRAAGSQPLPTMTAVAILDAADAWDDALVAGALDWLATVAPAAGGATFVLPGVETAPRGPHVQPLEGLPPSLTVTGLLAAPLLRREVRHPFADAAVAWLWSALEPPGTLEAYDLRGALAFLGAVGEDPRRAAAFEALRPSVRHAEQPDAGGEVHGALALVGSPAHPAVGVLVDPAAVEADLDALNAAQEDDGGWSFGWPAWSPAATTEWRGVVTVEALLTLRAAGRLG